MRYDLVMDQKVKGRAALVTGGSQGIGREVAKLLARDGAAVAITYRSQRAKADAVVAELKSEGADAFAVEMDLASPSSIQAAIEAVVARWGAVDILVNNAVDWGTTMPTAAPAFEAFPVAEWQRSIRSNLEGTFFALQAAVPSMRARGFGRIVNISSGVALDGVVGGSPYAAAKAGLHGVTQVLARELGPAGILVNVVVPGLTETERVTDALQLTPEVRERRGKAYPIGRLLGPEEVAPTIAFLASGLNTAVTGEIVRASGGRPM
jgi:3-oxoacyl-[acyl-carrier protein] reductase